MKEKKWENQKQMNLCVGLIDTNITTSCSKVMSLSCFQNPLCKGHVQSEHMLSMLTIWPYIWSICLIQLWILIHAQIKSMRHSNLCLILNAGYIWLGVIYWHMNQTSAVNQQVKSATKNIWPPTTFPQMGQGRIRASLFSFVCHQDHVNKTMIEGVTCLKQCWSISSIFIHWAGS